MKHDTILLFQEPERYFFPQMHGIVYAPLRIRNVRLRFWLYLIVYRFPFLCVPVLFGPWKYKIRTARQVILFDFGYIPGIESYIRRINPSCRVFLFYWNMITKSSRSYQIFSDPDSIYSTDQRDCKKYGLRYQHIFYFRAADKGHSQGGEEYGNRLFFFGLDKGRGTRLLRLKRALEAGGLQCDLSVFSESHNKKYRASIAEILAKQMLSYEEYCSRLERCGILLDINQTGQTALSMRVMEALFYSKKLITSNREIAAYDFYDENNILILDGRMPDPEILRDFIKKPFHPYSGEALYRYSYEHWKEQFGRYA